MPYIDLDDCISVDVDTNISTSEVHFDIDADDIDGLEDCVKSIVLTLVKEEQLDLDLAPDARSVAVEILRMLADLLALE